MRSYYGPGTGQGSGDRAKMETDEVSALKFKCSPSIITRIGKKPILSFASVIYPYPPAVFLTELKQTSAGVLVISIITNCTLAETKINGPQKGLFVSQ